MSGFRLSMNVQERKRQKIQKREGNIRGRLQKMKGERERKREIEREKVKDRQRYRQWTDTERQRK